MPDSVHLWLPLDDEHALAASLGMCERDPALLRELVEAAQEQAARDMPGVRVTVHRWHVWRVVEAMRRAGAINTPDGRAAAYAMLADDAPVRVQRLREAVARMEMAILMERARRNRKESDVPRVDEYLISRGWEHGPRDTWHSPDRDGRWVHRADALKRERRSASRELLAAAKEFCD